MTEQLAWSMDGPDRARWSAYDADFTPVGVARQGLAAVQLFDARGRPIERPRPAPASIWDPAAGAGGFGQVAREMFPDTVLVATEVRGEERPHLEHHYDHVSIGEFAAGYPIAGRPSLVITNPPWSAWTELVELVSPMIEAGSVLSLLGPVSWCSSFEPAGGLDVMSRIGAPMLELRIPERIKFRRGINPRNGQPYGSDNRMCAWWVWMRRPKRKPKQLLQWSTFVLPRLPKAEYEWIVRPGTEYLAQG